MLSTDLQVGLAAVDVTPPVGIFLAGYAGRQLPSDGVYGRLKASCIAMQAAGEQPVLMVTIDWLGFYDRTDAARARICDSTGVAPERILLCGTHTHCGPVLRREMDARRHGALDENYISSTLAALAQAAGDALARLQPAQLRVGTGWCGISASRRRPDGAGGVQFKPSLDAPHDHQVEVLAVQTPSGDLRHVLFSYACHPTSTGAITQIGGDYPAFACQYIEHKYPGVSAAFFQGCAGDQKVDARDAAGDGFHKLSVDEVRGRGEALGEAVVRVLAAADLRTVEGAPVMQQQRLELATDVPEDAELTGYLQSPADFVREWAQHHLDLRAAGTPAPHTFGFEVQTVRWGTDLAWIALSGEMSVEYALRYRREHGARFGAVWSLGYANEIVGYIPVRRQLAEGGYEVVDNNRRLLYPGPFAQDTEERISAAVVRCLS